MSIESVMPFSPLNLCLPFSSSLQSCPASWSPSESVIHMRWPTYWSFSFSISLSSEYSGLISFRMDWLDLLAAQGTLKSLLQHHSSKASILRHLPFFKVQVLHPYMTTGKTIVLTMQTFANKVLSLLFNTLSRLVIAFLQKSNYLSISWLQSPSTVILEPKKIKSVTISIVSPSICREVMGSDAMIFVFWMLNFNQLFFHLHQEALELLSAIKVISFAYLRLLIFLPAILIPACKSSSMAFHMMYSVCKLNKQGANIKLDLLFFQFWTSPLFLVWF